MRHIMFGITFLAYILAASVALGVFFGIAIGILWVFHAFGTLACLLVLAIFAVLIGASISIMEEKL